MVYPSNHEVKIISEAGHPAHEGRTYHVGEALAGKSVGRCKNGAGKTELHFANLCLGHLAFGTGGGRFKPAPYIAPDR